MQITESNPMETLGWIKVLYQRVNEAHFVGAMDRDQVCVQRQAVELSFGPAQFASNKSVAVGAMAIPERRTGAALKLHTVVS